MYKALISFSGVVNMAQGEIRDIPDSSVVEDLLRAGYIEAVDAEVKEEVDAGEEKKATKKNTKKK